MKHDRVLVVLAFSIVAALAISTHKAYAHFPESTGSLTAVLHVEPDDDPIAGQPESLELIFDDSSNHFRLADCNCKLSVSYQGQPLYSTDLSPPDTGDTVYDTKAIPFTFSQAGIYQITLQGQPTNNASFKAFSLTWNIPVAAAPEPSSTSLPSLLKYFAVIAAIFLLIGGFVFVLN